VFDQIIPEEGELVDESAYERQELLSSMPEDKVLDTGYGMAQAGMQA